jgi:hypothetical protein
MLVYWIYALLSIFYSWLFYKLTNKNGYGIIFYILSLFIIVIYYLIVIIINLFIQLKYRSVTKSLECNYNHCKKIIKRHLVCANECKNSNDSNVSEECNNYCNDDYQNILCKNIFQCENHYLCKPSGTKCVVKEDGCEKLIKEQLDILESKKEKELKDIIKAMNKNGIRKEKLDDYLEINCYVLSLLALLYFLYLFYKKQITIILDLTFLDINHLKHIIKNI